MNVEFYSSFERPIVAIVTTHASVDDLSKNIPFYRTLARFLYEGGLKKYPQFDFAIINALEVTDIQTDFQLETFYQGRQFFLVILKDTDSGYLYEPPIIREHETMDKVMTADTIDSYLTQYKNEQLRIYLKTETQNTKPFYKKGILQVYGSNFIQIVKERSYLQEHPGKALLLMFTKDHCPKCDWDEAFFDKLAAEERGYFLFAKMNIDKNFVTSDYRPHLYDLKDGKPMLQYLAILPDGAQIKRF